MTEGSRGRRAGRALLVVALVGGGAGVAAVAALRRPPPVRALPYDPDDVEGGATASETLANTTAPAPGALPSGMPAGLPILRRQLEEALDGSGIELTASPGVEPLLDGPAVPVRAPRRLAQLEAVLADAGAVKGVAALVRPALRFLGRDDNGLRFRLYRGRVHVRLDHEPDPPPGVSEIKGTDRYLFAKDGASMVYVDAGPFSMGADKSDNGEDPEAMPIHEVTLAKGYLIDEREVSIEQYRKFLAAVAQEGHKTCPKDEPEAKDHQPTDWGTPRYAMMSSGPDSPAQGVDWWDARAYAAWAGKRLPTEAEWEKAARGHGDRIYPWGDDEPKQHGAVGTASPFPDGVKRANWRGEYDGYLFAAPPGKFPRGRSPYGLLDAAGNVWEWTSSTFELYPGAFPHLAEKYPERETQRIFRGGSWDGGTQDMRLTHRHWRAPDHREPSLGLRCVAEWR